MNRKERAPRKEHTGGLGRLNIDGLGPSPAATDADLASGDAVVNTAAGHEAENLREIELVVRELEAEGLPPVKKPILQPPRIGDVGLLPRSPQELSLEISKAAAWLEYFGDLEARLAAARYVVRNRLDAMKAARMEEARRRLGPKAGRAQLSNEVLSDTEFAALREREAKLSTKIRLLGNAIRQYDRHLRTTSRQVTIHAIEQQSIARGAGLAKRRAPSIFGRG
jgi:hypothetical protein